MFMPVLLRNVPSLCMKYLADIYIQEPAFSMIRLSGTPVMVQYIPERILGMSIELTLARIRGRRKVSRRVRCSQPLLPSRLQNSRLREPLLCSLDVRFSH